MRNLSTYNQTQTSKTITEPFYLLHLGFDVPVYFCSLKTITIDAITWSASRKFTVSGLASNAAKSRSASLTIDNVDSLVSGLILSEGCAGKDCQIYKGYGTPIAADLELLFYGEMDSATINTDNVSISLIAKNSTRFTPNIFIAAPLFNHLPPAGTVIKSGNTTITLKAQ